MLPILLAGALIAAQPSVCPSDLIVSNPRVRLVRMESAGQNDYVVIVDIKNRGTAAQRKDVAQHLDMSINIGVEGTQAIPPLRAGQNYTATYPFQIPRTKHKPSHPSPWVATFHFVIDDAGRRDENCTTANDVTITL
jgi:hypothetical protein